MDPAIQIENISKTFRLPHEKHSSLKSLFVNFYKRKRTYELQHALQNVSFNVNKGEFFGIVGRNGSGKSTLLKIMAGIYAPSKGQAVINGSLTPFIELGVGFNPELTGRENVFLNGALLGFNRKDMNAMYKDIVGFAELEKFMDQKLKNYSSGMQVRLAFSIAIRAKSDILLLDEVLAVGDTAFQQKCYDYFDKLKSEKKTVILISHSMPAIERYCDKAMLLENGEIKKIGEVMEVVDLYNEMFLREEIERLSKERNKLNSEDYSPIKVLSCKTYLEGKEKTNFDVGSPIEIHLTLKSNEDIKRANVGIHIRNRDKTMVVSTDTEINGVAVELAKDNKLTIVFKIDGILANGIYQISSGMADISGLSPKMLKRAPNIADFTVLRGKTQAVVEPKVNVQVINGKK